MARKRTHRTKLAKTTTAQAVRDVTAKVDPKLDGEWKKLLHHIEDAQSRGAEAFDELWEAVGSAVHHNPPLFVLGGYKSVADFFQRLLKTDARTATRNMLVAKYATPKQEEDYGTSNIYAAILFIEAKLGELGGTLPVAFERLKIPVTDGKHARMVPFEKATFAEIEAATRALTRKKSGQPATDRSEAAIARVLGKHAAFKKVHFTVRSGLVHVRGIPLASLDLFARVLSTVKLPPVEKPTKKR